MTDNWLLKYQSLLLKVPITKLKVCGNLDPSTFLLPKKENETPDHDCSEFLTLSYAAWEDLMNTPLDNFDTEIFTDSIFFVWDTMKKAGYTILMAEEVLEANSLTLEVSA